jgi:hypothetical protein
LHSSSDFSSLIFTFENCGGGEEFLSFSWWVVWKFYFGDFGKVSKTNF